MGIKKLDQGGLEVAKVRETFIQDGKKHHVKISTNTPIISVIQ